jgi:L-malate glycosyltransferase
VNARPLRLAFLASPNEIAAREWMAWFAAAGHRVDLIVRAGAEVAPGLADGIGVARMRPYRGPLFGRLSALSARRVIGEVIHRLEPDVLHVHDLTTGFGWLARISGFHPYVVTPWGSDLYRIAPASTAARTLTRLTLRSADVVTVNSRHLAETAIRAGARRAAIQPVQFGVETDVYEPRPPDTALLERLGLRGRRVVLAPRQIAPLYDQAAIVRALPMLPDDVAVLMSARNAIPDTLAELTALADGLGVRERLVLVPTIPHDEMPAYLSIASAVVTVPHSDATAVTILEALAAGRPVVGSDLPSPREWLDETWPDLIVPPGAPGAIASAVRTALGLDAGTLLRRSAAARQVVVERAERSTNMARMEQLYCELAAGSRAALANQRVTNG